MGKRSSCPMKVMFEVRFNRYVEHASACNHISLIIESCQQSWNSCSHPIQSLRSWHPKKCTTKRLVASTSWRLPWTTTETSDCLAWLGFEQRSLTHETV